MNTTIGVDFDNTLVCYDDLFYKLARNKDLIPKETAKTKIDVRDYLRSIGKEEAWIKLQAEGYGPEITQARPFPGVKDFFKHCLEHNIPIYIISHKTRYPFKGPKQDLHAATQKWLSTQGFYDSNDIGLSKNDVFLELTKEKKIERIQSQGCTHFIDDLPEFLSQSMFPIEVKRYLFDPSRKHNSSKEFECVHSWKELTQKIK